jgi:cytochrome b pre-mRNA-processing protein 3
MAGKAHGVYGSTMIIFRQRQDEPEAAERLYAACVAAARRPVFFLELGVPDTLQGRFEIMTLHLFAMVHRLMRDPGDDRDLARSLAEAFVADMDDALRGLGVGDTRIPKRMQTFYGSFAGRLASYEKALADSREALTASVERNVFPGGDADRQAAALAAYLVDAADAVRAAPLVDLRAGRVPFPEPAVAAPQ